MIAVEEEHNDEAASNSESRGQSKHDEKEEQKADQSPIFIELNILRVEWELGIVFHFIFSLYAPSIQCNQKKADDVKHQTNGPT